MAFLIGLWITMAVICAIIASSRGRSPVGWFFIGFLLSFFGIILVAVLPSKKPAEVIAGAETATNETHTRCPDCRELVRLDARKCKHCGTPLTPAQPALAQSVLPVEPAQNDDATAIRRRQDRMKLE